MPNDSSPRKRLVANMLFPVVALFLFAFAYYLNFNTVPRIRDVGNPEILKAFNTYGAYGGWALGFVSLVIAYILMGIKRLVRLKGFTILNPLILGLAYAPWYILATSLAKEPRYTDIARAVLDVFVDPLKNASLVMLTLTGAWFVVEGTVLAVKKFRVSKNVVTVVALLCTLPLFGAGCLSRLEDFACSLLPDSDHCYQASAVQGAEPDDCERIQGARFKGAGSNPPKDKCYLTIAENTGDLDACKKIRGGLMSYSPEECYLTVATKFENPDGCKLLAGADKTKCRDALGASIESADVIAIDDQIAELKTILQAGEDPELTKQLSGLETRRTDLLDVLTKTNKADYERQSDPINKDILGDYAVGDLDRESKDKLIALNERLKAKGHTMTQEQVNTLKEYYKFMSDPANDIEQMDDAAIVKNRWNEKLGNVVDKFKIWKSSPSENEAKLDEQLRFYERMLERQATINAGLSEFGEDVKRNVELVSNAIKDKARDVAKDKIIETVFGEITNDTVGITTKVLGEAIDVVKSEAKSKEFRGLVRAYNLGMQEELGKFGGDVNKAHAEVVRRMQENPYEYEDVNTFAKYGNILENKDCDGSNPHCVNKEVFWKSMKKSYSYQNNSR